MLQNHTRLLIQEVSHLKAELDNFHSHPISLDSHPNRDAAKVSGPVLKVPAGIHPPSQICAANLKASGPVSKVSSDILSKKKLASMASVPLHLVPFPKQGARAPLQTLKFMSALVASNFRNRPRECGAKWE